MTHSRLALLTGPILAAAAATALAGCGAAAGGSSQASVSGSVSTSAPAAAAVPAATRNPCDLLSQSDVATALGGPVAGNADNGQGGMCGYHLTDNPGYAVNLSVSSWESIQNAARSGNKPPTTMSGVGDEALVAGANLYVRKGTEGFLVTALSVQNQDSEADQLAMARTFALKIVARM